MIDKKLTIYILADFFLMLVMMSIVNSKPVFAKVINGKTAKIIYKNALKNQPSVNTGDGVLSKSGIINCFEIGYKKPYEYECEVANQSED